MSVKLFNTMTRRKEQFVPLEDGKVKFYVCGPTVYDYIHIGNGRAFTVFDVLRRFLEFLDYDVTYVMNLTDIDDKIIERARQKNVEVDVITRKFSQAFFQDLEQLGMKPADVYPRATEHVDMIISLIQKLVEKSMAYESGGDVFFDVSKFAGYGKLSGKKLEELRVGARISVDDKKRNPLDFVLWKAQKPGEPAWESPWGPGRPGWHIECSAMSMKYLGESFDIHAGGIDLIFPHHENEIAQSEGATNETFVRYWLHNGFLQLDGDKMSKSLGNFRTVRDILKHYSGVEIRLFFLQKHYRSPFDLTEDGLQSATQAASRLKIFYDKLTDKLSVEPVSRAPADSAEQQPATAVLESVEALKAELVEAMGDDLNTPVAVARLFDMVRETNKLLSRTQITQSDQALLRKIKDDIDAINSFLGVIDPRGKLLQTDLVGELVELLIEVRSDLRARKAWDLADKIRDQLKDKGIILEDKATTTEWRMP